MKLIKPKYIYLASGLPRISWASRTAPLDLRGICEEIGENLLPSDRALWEYLFFPYDLDNLLQIPYSKPGSWRPLANFSREQIETFQKEPETIPPLFEPFWQMWSEAKDELSKAQLEQNLYEHYYQKAQTLAQGFLRSWFGFLASYQTLMRDWVQEDFDQAIPQTLQENVAPFREEGAFFHVDMEEQSAEIRKIWENTDIRQREEGMDQYLFERLEELRFFRYFGLESILVYGLQIQLLARWEEMEASNGVEQFERAVRQMEKKWMQSA